MWCVVCGVLVVVGNLLFGCKEIKGKGLGKKQGNNVYSVCCFFNHQLVESWHKERERDAGLGEEYCIAL